MRKLYEVVLLIAEVWIQFFWIFEYTYINDQIAVHTVKAISVILVSKSKSSLRHFRL